MNFATMRLAAALMAALAASSTLVATAQTSAGARASAARSRIMARGLMVNGPMTSTFGTTFQSGFPIRQMQRLPELGTLREIVGLDRITNISGSFVTLRAPSGAMAAIRMPASRIQAMGLRDGTLVQFRMLSGQRFQILTTVRTGPIK